LGRDAEALPGADAARRLAAAAVEKIKRATANAQIFSGTAKGQLIKAFVFNK